jgi:benzoate/toluate 1,2-dioxygenase alpha subunit/2,4,5-trichlorophenoxyacetic acid oxygenase 1
MIDVDHLIDDRPEAGIFRVRREIFRDPAVFAQEMTQVFESTWIFIGLETQVRNPNDFFTTYLGRQPILVTRDADGKLHCLLNSCRHRGTIVCPFQAGNRRLHVCRYHGWSYDSSGRNRAITDIDDGQYPRAFIDTSHDLIAVPRFASYRGLMFASLSPDVPSLEEHLGDARMFLDLVLDQGPEGFEYVPGPSLYTFDANWKLQFENGLDFYHFNTTHAGYVDVLARRAEMFPYKGPVYAEDAESEPDAQGTFSFPRGHSVMYSVRRTARGSRPFAVDRDTVREVALKVGSAKLRWMMRQRNLTIFPNLQIIDITSLQLRTWRPLAPDKTEMTSHCMAPIGESAEARRLRIRQYEDFFNPSGLATSDDNVMYEYCQDGYGAEADGWTQGYARGIGQSAAPPAAMAADLGIRPVEAKYGSLKFGDETCFHACYREWRRLMSRGSNLTARRGAA